MTAESDARIQSLLSSVSPRTLFQYKTNYSRYISWCESKQLIPSSENINDDQEPLFETLPISARLFHCFIIDAYFGSNTNVSQNKDEADFEQLTISMTESNGATNIKLLKKTIHSLKFLFKLCQIYNEQLPPLDESYLHGIIDLHTFWNSLLNDGSKFLIEGHDGTFKINQNLTKSPTFQLLKISMNLWNPQTTNLSKIYFNSALKKHSLLLDFYFSNILRLSYSQKSLLTLNKLKVHFQSASTQFPLLSLDLYSTTRNDVTHQPINIVAQDCPIVCPINNLACYLFLKFYGENGIGFPKDLETQIPLLSKNNSDKALDYPDELYLNSSYLTIYNYCNLSYDKDDQADDDGIKFPTWDNEEYATFFEESNLVSKSAFNYNVPLDYSNILNLRYPGAATENYFKVRRRPSDSILKKFFPELDEIRENSTTLSPEMEDLITLLETLRLVFVSNLPILFNLFPKHEIFQIENFNDDECKKYISTLPTSNGSPFKIFPGVNIQKFTKSHLFQLVMENSPSDIEEFQTRLHVEEEDNEKQNKSEGKNEIISEGGKSTAPDESDNKKDINRDPTSSLNNKRLTNLMSAIKKHNNNVDHLNPNSKKLNGALNLSLIHI